MAQAVVAGQGAFPDLRGYRMDQLVLATVDAAASMAWARAMGLLTIMMLCDSAVCAGQNRQMAQVTDKRADGVRWKCTKKQCRKEYSIRKGSFFERSHLSIKQILLIMYYWYSLDFYL